MAKFRLKKWWNRIIFFWMIISVVLLSSLFWAAYALVLSVNGFENIPISKSSIVSSVSALIGESLAYEQNDRTATLQNISQDLFRIKAEAFFGGCFRSLVCFERAIDKALKERPLSIISIPGQDPTLDARFTTLANALRAEIASVADSAEGRTVIVERAVALTNNIDQLNGVVIRNATIDGTLEGLTDAHIPNNITVSGYLPTSGGTIAGSLTVEGAVTLSSFSATSTTATSTIAGDFQTAGNLLVGTGTSLLDQATSTFREGVNLSAGCFAVNCVCVGGGGSFLSLSDTQSSFTANRILHTNSAGDALTDTAGFVFTGTALGIGTTSPYAALSVVGATGVVADRFHATSTTATSTFAGGIAVETSGFVYDFSTNFVGIGLVAPTAQLQLNTTTGANAFLVGSTTTQFIVDSVGNVGVGTSSPSSLFSINAVANFRSATSTFSGTGGVEIAGGCFSVRGTCVGASTVVGTMTIGNALTDGTAGSILFVDGSGNLGQDNANFFWDDTNNKLGIASTSPWGKIGIEMDTTNPSFVIANQGSTTPTLYVCGVNQNGNIGLGTTTPKEKLVLSGGSLFQAGGDATTMGTPIETHTIFDTAAPDANNNETATGLDGAAGVFVSGRYAYVTG